MCSFRYMFRKQIQFTFNIKNMYYQVNTELSNFSFTVLLAVSVIIYFLIALEDILQDKKF